MIDVHCHLNLHAFDTDYDAVIDRSLSSSVTAIINTGTSLASSKKAVQLAHQYDQLYAIVGIHPHHADKTDAVFEGELSDNWKEDLHTLAQDAKVVGIGEIGLDYFRYQSNGIVEKTLQEEVFIAQIELAHTVNKPLQIHNRLAGEDVIDVLKRHRHLLRQHNPGMFHCFAGSMDVLHDALDLGFMIGFDGNITYPGLAPKETVSLSDIARHTPLDHIVVETDSPFLTPVPHRGKRNEPQYVILVAEYLARLHNVSTDEMDAITTKNARQLFGL